MSLRTIASVRNCMKTCMSTMAAQDSERNILAAVIQMTSTADKRANLTRASSHVKKAASMGAKLAFLPEGFDFIGDTKNAARELAEPIDGPTVAAYRELARKHGIALSLGGLHEAVPGELDGGKIRNTHVLIDGSGEILSTYSKAHLFDVEIPGKFKLRESDWTTAGDEMKPPEAVPAAGGLRVGLGICYDLRFPEMAQYLARRGADVITYPSAFTVATGLAHWESLLRARAIETQCYVVAAAQTGKHNEKRSTFGHSVIIDPWGTVVAQCGEGTLRIRLLQFDTNLTKDQFEFQVRALHSPKSIVVTYHLFARTCPWRGTGAPTSTASASPATSSQSTNRCPSNSESPQPYIRLASCSKRDSASCP